MSTRLLARRIAVFALLCGDAVANPLIVERDDELPFQAVSVAHAGDELIALVPRIEPGCLPAKEYAISARFYSRSASGQWNFVSTLANECSTDFLPRFMVAMTASAAVLSLPSGIRIFDRTPAGWTEQVRPPAPGAWPMGPLVAIHDDYIFASNGACSPDVAEMRKLGQWSVQSVFSTPAGQCVTSLDAAEDQLIFVGRASGTDAPRTVRIYEPDEFGWYLSAEFTVPGGNDGDIQPGDEGDDGDDGVGSVAAIHGELALVGNGDEGALVFRKIEGDWMAAGKMDNPGRAQHDGDASIEITDEYVLRAGGNAYRYSGAGYLYRRNPDGSLAHIVNFVSDTDHAIGSFTLVGNRAIALTGDFGTLPVEFEVPADLFMNPLQQQDFEGALGSWSFWPHSSQFAVVNNGTSNVWRQSNVTGEASALYGDEWADQSISADIHINSFNGADRWVGLMTRWTNENYYYVTLRDSNRISFRKMLYGTFTELASIPFDVQPGQTWNLRLQSSGTEHTVYVQGQLVMRVYDDSLPFSFGRPGIRMYKASADFDNIVMSPGPTTSHTFSHHETQGGQWMGGPRDFVQENLTAGASRWLTGTGAEDQTVSALVTTTQFSPALSSWVGLITRYVDSGNYYYVTVRRDNQLSLRKLTNGVITVLATIPFQIPANGTFGLQLEAVRDRLRVHVNGVQRMEYVGAEIMRGKSGAMTYRARAVFGGYTVYEP